jgi:hypothetical protein
MTPAPGALDAAGPGKDLTLPQLIALGVGKAILEGAPSEGILPVQMGRRMLRDVPLAELMEMAPPLMMAANYETMRGILRMEAGDVTGARERFRRALFGDKDKKGRPEDVVFGFPGAHAAYRYLLLTEEKD